MTKPGRCIIHQKKKPGRCIWLKISNNAIKSEPIFFLTFLFVCLIDINRWQKDHIHERKQLVAYERFVTCMSLSESRIFIVNFFFQKMKLMRYIRKQWQLICTAKIEVFWLRRPTYYHSSTTVFCFHSPAYFCQRITLV